MQFRKILQFTRSVDVIIEVSKDDAQQKWLGANTIRQNEFERAIPRYIENYRRKNRKFERRHRLSSRGETNFNYRSFIKRLKISPAFHLRGRTRRPGRWKREKERNDGSMRGRKMYMGLLSIGQLDQYIRQISRESATRPDAFLPFVCNWRENVTCAEREAFRNSAARVHVYARVWVRRDCGKMR